MKTKKNYLLPVGFLLKSSNKNKSICAGSCRKQSPGYYHSFKSSMLLRIMQLNIDFFYIGPSVFC